MKSCQTVFALSAVLLLAACSDNAPGKAAFEKAVNRYAAEKGVCVPVPVKLEGNGATAHRFLGEEQIKIPVRNAEGGKTNEAAAAQMRIMDDEGFYRKGPSESLEWPAAGKIELDVYNLTDKGRSRTEAGGGAPRFCIGSQKVEKINWYTEPAVSDGMTVSKVSYEARFVTEKWAEKLLKAGGSDWKHPDATRTKTATLVKTNDGWRDIRELR